MKFEKKIYTVIEYCCVAITLVMIVIVLLVVIGRYSPWNAPAWGEELSIFCLTWLGLLSAVLAETRQAHIKVEVAELFLPPGIFALLKNVFTVLKIVFASVLVWQGIKQVRMTWESRMASINLSQGWWYLSGLAMAVGLVLVVMSRLKRVLFPDKGGIGGEL